MQKVNGDNGNEKNIGQEYRPYAHKNIKQVINTENYSFVNCSCKKSHCLKKYCSCFMHNKPCS